MTDTPGPGAQDTSEHLQAQADLRAPLWGVAAFAALGAVFSAVSTNDFMRHLDRQVHSIHCSFIPGAGAELGESGCRTVMMSTYSSFFRESLWGGIPVSVWSLATFAFLVYRALVLALRRSATRAEASFLWAATGLPLAMTVIYGALAVFVIGATCKVCVGIYVASVGAFVAALLAWRQAPSQAAGAGSSTPYALWFLEGVGFVAALTVVYLAAIPGSGAGPKAGSCGSLVQGDDPSGVMLELSTRGKVPAIEVVDPLCPACRGFDERLSASALKSSLALRGVLFPLDSTCNWMVTETLHPGACAVSEAILCANGLGADKDPAEARRLLAWAMKHQEELRATAQKDEPGLRARLERDFPKVKGCLGGTAVRNKLTKSLRWAVANAVPVLTPQLFVRDRRLCDEDTDLGLEYTLRRAIAQGDMKAVKK
ncbi:MAG TPA: vitamin K epoxide reductase family protein [Myxococcales bacterium]|jgi:uncharacterized membrane protein